MAWSGFIHPPRSPPRELAQRGPPVPAPKPKDPMGGGPRPADLPPPGSAHDVCSAIPPSGYASPLFPSLPLEEHGLEWVHPPAPLAHPFDDGSAAVLERSVRETSATLGADAEAYEKLMGPIVADWDRLVGTLLGPLRPPRQPFALARFRSEER